MVTSLNLIFQISDARPWLKNYPKGLPVNIDVDKYPNLNAFIDEGLKKYHARQAFPAWARCRLISK